MNHQDIDPSLCSAEPLLESLDGGFSPPVDTQARQEQDSGGAERADLVLGPQSQF